MVREAPIADAGPPVMACTNQTVRLRRLGLDRRRRRGQRLLLELRRRLAAAAASAPTHVFERPGSYTVTLTITGDARGSCGALDTDETTVTVVEAPRHRDRRARTGSPPAPASPTTRRWPATSTCAAPIFAWDFGDGATATGADGRARLRRARRAGPSRCARSCPAPTRAAARSRRAGSSRSTRRRRRRSTSPDRIAAGALVLFDASASSDPDGAITGFAWDFGDGATASGVQAQHRFAAAGHLRGPAGGDRRRRGRQQPRRADPHRRGQPAAGGRPGGRRRSSARACRTPGRSPRTPPT